MSFQTRAAIGKESSVEARPPRLRPVATDLPPSNTEPRLTGRGSVFPFHARRYELVRTSVLSSRDFDVHYGLTSTTEPGTAHRGAAAPAAGSSNPSDFEIGCNR
jgi:hypothetical protein